MHVPKRPKNRSARNNSPNVGLTSGFRFYITGCTVGQAKKCFTGWKKIRLDAFGRVEVIRTPNHGRGYPKQIRPLPIGAKCDRPHTVYGNFKWKI